MSEPNFLTVFRNYFGADVVGASTECVGAVNMGAAWSRMGAPFASARNAPPTSIEANEVTIGEDDAATMTSLGSPGHPEFLQISQMNHFWS